MFHRVLLTGVTVLAIAGTSPALCDTVAQYEFDGDLRSTTGQVALQPVGYPGVAGAPSVSYETATIGGETADVARLSDGTALVVRHGAPSNGGGGYVNQYTIVLDVAFPLVGEWISLYQTNDAYDDEAGEFDLSSSNDGDWFVNTGGGIGISGNYGGTIQQDVWHRIALTVDNSDTGLYTSYIDGVQVQQNSGLGTDGRFALYGPDTPELYDWFFLFADESGAGEMGEVLINSFRFVDRTLTAEEIAALGVATAAGIPTEPCEALFLWETFDDYADDAAVSAAGWQIVDVNSPDEDATWTVTNPGGRRNPPTLDGSPSSGGFMVSDSDAAGGSNPTGSGMSHDLISPAFSTEGSSTVWLHTDCVAQLNDNGEAVFDVDVSTDGGATWSNVFRRIAPGRTAAPLADNTTADGWFGQLDVDLSGVAADSASVQLRFRHFEPNDDWFVAIDNVIVDCVGPPVGGDCEVLPGQGFSGGLGALAAVSLEGNIGSETWHTTDKGGRYSAGAVSGRGVNRLNHPGGAPDFAIVDSDANPDPAENEWLATPAFNFGTFTEVFLHFSSETVVDGDATAEVLASIDGGSTFPIRIFKYTGGGTADAGFDSGEEPFFGEYVFSVPEVVGESNVVFAFHYESPGDQWWWAVDDVRVTGTADVCDPRECGLRNFAVSYDADTNSVTGTWDLLSGDEGFQVLEGDRVVVDDLPATATSFTDSSPPAGGLEVVYTLQPVFGGAIERDCVAGPIQTYLPPSGLVCRPRHESSRVDISWDPGANLDATGFELRLGGDVITTVGTGASSHVDYLDLAGLREHLVLEYELVTMGGADAIALPCRAVISSGTIALADDFEDYADDFELEAGGWFPIDEAGAIEDATWTVQNPGGRRNPPTFDGRPSAGRFVISDSDEASGDNLVGSGMSHDLWSPVFSCEGMDSVWLHMDVSAQLNNNGKCVFDIDVSTDQGASWTNLFRRVAPARTEAEPVADVSNADGYFGKLSVDISSAAAGEPQVRLRVRHFEPEDDWWIAFDNLIVDDIPPLAGGDETIFSEDFSAGLGAMSVVSLADPENTGAETWSMIDKGGRYVQGAVAERGVNRMNHPAAGVEFVIMESDTDPDPAEDEYLLTPEIDCSEMLEVYLHWECESPASGSVQDVLVSLDGGRTFEPEPVFSYTNGGLYDSGEDPFYTPERVIRVDAAAGESQVVFAYHWVGQDDYWWAVDDIRVTGTRSLQVPGDANQDGVLNMADAMNLFGVLFMGEPELLPCGSGLPEHPGNVGLLDWQPDGVVDIADGVGLLFYLFADGPAHPLAVGGAEGSMVPVAGCSSVDL